MVGFKKTKIKFRKKSIILATHVSYFDFITVPYLTYPKRGNVVSTSYWFRRPYLAKLFSILGVIQKDQYKSDIRAIKQMVSVFKRGGIVYLFPEGQMSLDGRTQLLVPGIEKLIKKYRPNVYTVKTNGAYLVRPKWCPKLTKGHIDCDVNLLFPEEDIPKYTSSEIYDMLVKDLAHDDVKWLEEHSNYHFTNKNKAQGIGNLLYKCPSCGKEFTLFGEESSIKCSSCEFEVKFQKYNYDFEENPYFKNLTEFYDYQKGILKKELEDGGSIEDDAKLSYYERTDENILGDYHVKMNTEVITFTSEKEEISVELDKVINFVVTLGISFEVPTPTKTYRIYPLIGAHAVKYRICLDIIKDMKEKEKNEGNNKQ